MDFSVGDDQFEIYENNNKLKVLLEIKKLLIYDLVDKIVSNTYDRYKSYVDFDVEKHFMNKIYTDEITSIYDYYEEENLDLVCCLLRQYGCEYVSICMKDQKLESLHQIFGSKKANLNSISASSLCALLDENILILKNANTQLSIQIYSNIESFVTMHKVINVQTEIKQTQVYYTLPEAETYSKDLHIKKYHGISALFAHYRKSLNKFILIFLCF